MTHLTLIPLTTTLTCNSVWIVTENILSLHVLPSVSMIIVDFLLVPPKITPMDTRMYEVEYADGSKQALVANVIVETMFASVDKERHCHQLLNSIIDTHKMKHAVGKDDAFVISSNGTNRQQKTTKGWEVLVQSKDGLTLWSKLKDMKDSYPVQLAEFVVQKKLQDKPAFVSWIGYTLKKKARIIAKVKSKYWQRTHKCPDAKDSKTSNQIR